LNSQKTIYNSMEGLMRLDGSMSGTASLPYNHLYTGPLADDIANICASDDRIRDIIEDGLIQIQSIMEQGRIKGDGHIRLLFCRDVDRLVDTPLYGLKDMVEMLAHTEFTDEKKSRNFFKLLRAMHELETDFSIFTRFDEAMEATKIDNIQYADGFYDDDLEKKEYGALTFVIFKLFQFSDWFEEKPEKERVSLILKRDVIDKTILEVLEPLKEEVDKYANGSKIVVFGPSNLKNYSRYDFHRARLEHVIFEEAKRNYENKPIFDFLPNKSLVTMMRYLRAGYDA
ncbi:hypothetical protein ACFL6I_21855, partial [candidate division KSB1 bacterium]